MHIEKPLIDLWLPNEDESVPRARHSLDILADTLPSRMLETTALLVSELVTNAVVHADFEPDEGLRLRVGSSGEKVRVEVHDSGPEFDAGSLRKPEPEQIGGWGLYLVQMLSNRWDVERGDPVVVWFEVDHP